MTAPVLAPDLTEAETVDCIDCNGTGFTWIRDGRDPEDLTEADCTSCNAAGVVPAEWVTQCNGCQSSFWVGDGCDHDGGPLCIDCRPGCRECAEDARDDAAYDAMRDAEVMAGGGW